LVLGLRLAGVELRAAHVLTGGGLAAALHELCGAADLTVVLEDDALPVRPMVREACDLLGLDPLMVASEGNLALVLPAAQAATAVEWLRGQARGADAAKVGTIVAERRQRVLSRNAAGGEQIVPVPRGERFPRIC
jgi:hydrogenase expression/formation protein HypE